MDRNIVHKLTYDDVLLKPRFSTIRSRSDVSLDTELGNKALRIPIVSANMDTVTGYPMVLAMDEMGGMGILHRFMNPDDVIHSIETLRRGDTRPPPQHVAASIGVNESAVKRAREYVQAGADVICVDIAHGFCQAMQETLEGLREEIRICGYDYVTVIAGNTSTYEATLALLEWGADVVKVGVGPGSLCSTRMMAGVGVPQLSAVMSAKAAVDRFNLDHRFGDRQRGSIIADGGIRHSGDIVKALAAGADAVMIGSLFAGCDEAPGGTIDGKFKKYRGMASVDAQKDWKGGQKDEDYHEEGEVKLVPCKGSVKPIVKKLCNGIQSGCAYMDARTLRELRRNSVHRFVRVTPLGYGENTPHLLDREG